MQEFNPAAAEELDLLFVCDPQPEDLDGLAALPPSLAVIIVAPAIPVPGLAAAVSLWAPASLIGALSFRISPTIQPGWATAAASLALLGMTFLIFSLPVEADQNRGRRGERNVSLQNMLRIAEALGVRVSDLVGEAEGRVRSGRRKRRR